MTIEPAAKSPEVGPTERLRGNLRSLGVLPSFLVLLLAAVLFVPNFATRANITDLLVTVTFVGFVALGMTFVVASGNFVDLSVGAQIGLSAVCVIALQEYGLPVALGVGLAACLLFGAVNSLTEWLKPGQAPDPAALADAVTAMTFTGLRRR